MESRLRRSAPARSRPRGERGRVVDAERHARAAAPSGCARSRSDGRRPPSSANVCSRGTARGPPSGRAPSDDARARRPRGARRWHAGSAPRRRACVGAARARRREPQRGRRRSRAGRVGRRVDDAERRRRRVLGRAAACTGRARSPPRAGCRGASRGVAVTRRLRRSRSSSARRRRRGSARRARAGSGAARSTVSLRGARPSRRSGSGVHHLAATSRSAARTWPCTTTAPGRPGRGRPRRGEDRAAEVERERHVAVGQAREVLARRRARGRTCTARRA